jgi:hypothetical protein
MMDAPGAAAAGASSANFSKDELYMLVFSVMSIRDEGAFDADIEIQAPSRDSFSRVKR